MFYDELVYQGTDPGGNLGGAFTASLAERELVVKGKYLHELTIGLKGDTATAAVLMTTFLDILNPFIFKVGQETRIQLRGRDLLALNMFLYGSVPLFWSADAINDDAKILGLKIPIFETIKSELSYSWGATRVAQTNVSGEVLELAARWSDKVLNPAPIFAIEQPFTTAAAAGRTNLGIQLPKLGDLIGMILFNTNAPTNVADASSVQRIQLYLDGVRSSQFNVGTQGFVKGFNQENQALLMQDVFANYSFIDLREDPIDVKGKNVEIEVDVEDASDAVRLIPIILKK